MNCNEATKKSPDMHSWQNFWRYQIWLGTEISFTSEARWRKKMRHDVEKTAQQLSIPGNWRSFVAGPFFFLFPFYGTKCQPGVAVHYCTTKMSPQQHPVTSHIFPFSFLGTISNSFRFRARCVYCNQIVMNENTLLMQFFWDSVYVSNIFLVIK